jgi:heavy metal efflux system protein
MISRIIEFSIRRRWFVLLACLAASAVGVWSLSKLPIDAVPDITNNQVQINMLPPALSPVEMEKQVTLPIETAVIGIPGLESTRSFSRNGFAQITAVFTDSTNIYFARQQVNERLTEAKTGLPPGLDVKMGPISTGLGEVYWWSVEFFSVGQGAPVRDGEPGWQSDGSYLTTDGQRLTDEFERAVYLRTVQDWVIRPQIKGVLGVAGADAIGGYVKQYLVQPDPMKLIAFGISFNQVVAAIESNNVSRGASTIEQNGEGYVVRVSGRVENQFDIGEIVVTTRGAIPVRIKDVAEVTIGRELRTGSASVNGREAVLGTALMLIGGNSRTVAAAADAKIKEINRTLPPGIRARTVLNRTQLVDATIKTVATNLAEGALLVILVLFGMLGNFRAAFITALVIPVTVLLTAAGMLQGRISANLMSLGALDFGLIVDGAVIITENSLRHLAERRQALRRSLSLDERLETMAISAKEMIQPTVYGQLIIMLVYVPLLTFSGVEGKTFTPMALTVIIAFILTLTFVPAMIAIAITAPVGEQQNWLLRAMSRLYRATLGAVIRRPAPIILCAALLFGGALLLFVTLGQEFTPTLDEKNLVMEVRRIPSTALSQSQSMQLDIERVISVFPQVSLVYSRTGTPDLAADPMPPNASDTYIILKPQHEWPDPDLSKDELIRQIGIEASKLPGNNFGFSQPIQMRFNELIAGVRDDVAVKIFGDEFERIGTAVGGHAAGLVFEGDRRFQIIVRLSDGLRGNIESLQNLPVFLPGGGQGATIPLSQVATFQFSEGPNQISRENGKRRVVVTANVRGRDIGSVVAEAQAMIADQVQLQLPSGYWLAWGGQFENLAAARERLMIVVPGCFCLIFLLLFSALGSVRDALIVFSAVPLALTGGVAALWLRGMPFSVSAAVGFIALSGIAVLNGLVMLTFIKQLMAEGRSRNDAIRDGALTRLRPVVMTALVASLGFVPMAVATGTGAEVQKPIATVVIGGLISATLLTLFVLPALYARFGRGETAPSEQVEAEQLRAAAE